MTSLPTPTAKETSGPVPGKSNKNARKMAAIVKGVLGGMILVAALVALFVWRTRVKHRRATRDVADIILTKNTLPTREKVLGD
jgi:hypothetical protein